MAGAHMAASSVHYAVMVLFLFIFQFRLPHASQDSALLFHNVLQGSSFASDIALSGDAKAMENSSVVQLTRPLVSSSGSVIYEDHIRFAKGHGFSTYFTFSVAAEGGGSLTFLVAPVGFNTSVMESNPARASVQSGNSQRFVAVEFDVTEASKHVGIEVGRFISLKSRNFSFSEGKLNGGKKLHSWVDYQPSYKKLEVRLSDTANTKPVGPLISFPIDLNLMWGNETMAVSLSSRNKNSSQSCTIYSWGIKWIINPHWMHSQPFDPSNASNDQNSQITRNENYCFLRQLGALILGITFGAVGALMVLSLWKMIGRRRPVVPMAPEDCTMSPMGFEYKKVKLVVDNPSKQDSTV